MSVLLTDVLDLRAALARLEGDEELLAEIAGLFLEDCPGLVGAMQDALARADSKGLERAAHTLKGSLGNFAAAPVVAAVARLEALARQGDLAQASEVCRGLEEEIERVKRALAVLHRKVAP